MDIKKYNDEMVEEMDLEQLKDVSGGAEIKQSEPFICSISCEKPGCSWHYTGKDDRDVMLHYVKHLIRHQNDPNYRV